MFTPLQSWERLTLGRRGWAVGSMLGLIATLFYFWGPANWGHTGSVNVLSFLSVPATPGILIAEIFFDLEALRSVYVALACAANYLFWGCYGVILYRVFRSNLAQENRLVGFALFSFFWSVVGMAYALNSGVVFNHPSRALLILLVALLLALVSLAPLFAFLATPTTQKF